MLVVLMVLIMVLLITLELFCVFILIKNPNTCKKRDIIIEAICAHQINCIYAQQKQLVDYDDMESYEATLYRFWDWGYENILPKEKYEIIKPYIQ